MRDPYPSDRAYVRDELARLDARLRIEVDRFEGPIDEFGALYITEAEVTRLLARGETDGGGRADAVEPQPLARHARRVEARRQATTEAGDALRFDRLVDRFGLDDLEREALLVAMAPDVEEKYATIYAYLQDDVTRRRPSVGFLIGLLDPDGGQLDARSHFVAGAPLVDASLIQVDGDGPLPTRPVRVDPRIISYVLGEERDDPALIGRASVSTPTVGFDGLDVDPTHRRTLTRLADPEGVSPPPVIAIHGPRGTRKTARVAAACAEHGTALITLQSDGVAPDEFGSTIDRVCREARLRDAAVHLAGILDAEALAAEAIGRLESLERPVYLTGEAPPSHAVRTAPSGREFVPIEVTRADFAARRDYWASIADLPAGVDPAAIASTFRLSRGVIDDVMEMARANARAADEPLDADHVYAASRSISSERLTDLATRIEPAYGWDDIVLPADTATQLREVADRLLDRGTVYTDWGFGERSSLGNGIVALFSGPSGTGKTMAAEVVAGHAGLHLYKVDLAEVVSKYVGETESNLSRVFDQAADSDAILLFDEADALFGERSEISDAHDRYANIEVDYLLQRVEEHDGAVILTTNLESNIDDAFVRRIHTSVEFPLPDRAARNEIWRRVFPPETPLEELDYEFLARLELTGGNIRNIALTSAFFAANRGTSVGMEEVVRAVKRECQKIGMPLQAELFGEHRDLYEAA